MATPKDNMEKASELLANDDDKIDLDYLRAIVGTDMKQQSKADTSHKMAFNPEACMSNARDLSTRDHRDNQSRTGLSERYVGMPTDVGKSNN
jgi:hypothetical protein